MKSDGSTPTDDAAGVEATSKARRGTEWAGVAILILLAVLCCKPLMSAGWFESHEKIRPIARALAAWHEISKGDLYPRWITAGYLGKGMPLFNFYPPAFPFLVAYAHALGVPLLLAAKVTIFLLFLVGSLGVYLWVRRHLGHPPAVVAGILYLYAPYHFVDVYVRGAMSEFMSLAALPFLFLAIDMLVDRLSAGRLAALALASATIVVSHFLAALMIAPLAAVYAVARAVRGGGGRFALGRIVAGGALGASLSAFYWLPSLAERDALSWERVNSTFIGYYSAIRHFVHPWQWLDPAWGFGGSAPDELADGMSFQIGVLLLAAAAASVLLVRSLGRGERAFVLLALGLGAASLLMTTAASRPLYVRVEILRMVQYPWRFLGPATLFVSAVGAGFVRVLAGRHAWLGPGLAAGCAAFAVFLSAEQRAVDGPLLVADDRVAIEKIVAGDEWSARFGNRDEYLPRDASVESADTKPGGPRPSGLGVEIGSVRARGADVTFEISSPTGLGVAVVPWYYFPGWEVSLDGRESQLVPEPDGLIAFLVPQGRHVARVRFGTTPPRVVGWLLSLGGVVSLGALATRERMLNRVRRPA